MRILAIGMCAAIVIGGCSRNSESFHRFTFTPPPPTPTSSEPTRHIKLRLQTLKGRFVTTGIDLPPSIRIGPNDGILKAKAIWRIRAAPTPVPPAFANPQLKVADDSVFVSTGTDIERIGRRSGRVLWRSTAASAPLTVSVSLVAAGRANTVVALNERNGRVLWRRAVCPVSTRVAAVAIDGQAVFGLCANPMKLIALRSRSGRALYTRILSESDRGTSLQLLGSGTLLADGFFDGAWMGDNFYFVREQTGNAILKRTNIELFRVRGNTADFIDRCCFDHNESYEPAKILPVNLLNGDMGVETRLAPEPDRFRQASGEGAYGPDGTLFAGGRFLYLYYGDTLFRYSRLDDKPTELLRDIDLVANAHADAFVAALDGDPNAVLARIDWAAKQPVLRPIAALDSIAPGEGAMRPMPIGLETLDGIPLVVSARGAVARVPRDCPLPMLAPENDAQMVWVLCTSSSGRNYIEELRLRS